MKQITGSEKTIPKKESAGVILCRKNLVTNRFELLLVHKRYTYAFADFIHGHYRLPKSFDKRYFSGKKKARAIFPPKWGAKSITTLLGEMTTEELLNIRSLNFEYMWYKVWLNWSASAPRDATAGCANMLEKKKAKFHAVFIEKDGGQFLLTAIRKAQGRALQLWEIPKGRPMNPRESTLICAMRELQEETGISRRDYVLIPGFKRQVRYNSDGTQYSSTYFLAFAKEALSKNDLGGIGWQKLQERHFMGEIDEIRWADTGQLRILNFDGRLLHMIRPALRYLKKYHRLCAREKK